MVLVHVVMVMMRVVSMLNVDGSCVCIGDEVCGDGGCDVCVVKMVEFVSVRVQ